MSPSDRGELVVAAQHPFTLLVATISAAVLSAAIITGYGRYVSALWPLLSLLLLLLAGWAHGMTRRRWHFTSMMCVSTATVAMGWLLGMSIRLVHCSRIRDEVMPLIRELTSYKSQHPNYPVHLTELQRSANFNQLHNVKIEEGRFLRSGDIDISPLHGADAVFYLASDRFACVVPIQKPLIVSITGFHVFRYSSREQEWANDYIVWWIMPS